VVPQPSGRLIRPQAARRTPHVLESGSGAGKGIGDHLACELRAIFEELAGILSSTQAGEPPDFARIAEMASRYETTFHMKWMGEIMEKHGVKLR
jgi:hypothetical protein